MPGKYSQIPLGVIRLLELKLDLYRDREQYLPPANRVAKVMFSVLSVVLSVHRGPHVTITHGALDWTPTFREHSPLDMFKFVQLGHHCIAPRDGSSRHVQTCSTWTSLYSTQRWLLQTCSNLFIMKNWQVGGRHPTGMLSCTLKFHTGTLAVPESKASCSVLKRELMRLKNGLICNVETST